MKLSQKADYAMRAMIDLAVAAPSGRLVRTADVARRSGAPEKFLESILTELRRAGLVESRRGAVGGHRLARSATRITAGDVWRAIDGPLALADRSSRPRAAPDGAARTLHRLWSDVEQAVERVVDGMTLDELARRAQEVSGVRDFAI